MDSKLYEGVLVIYMEINEARQNIEQPIISVITPVYNSEKFLKKCIESVLTQNFQKFELLLVNDGSSDNSSAICEEYAKKDSRIRVFHRLHAGVSAARNYGLDNASGDYVCFVDSDDYVGPNFLLDFYKNRIDGKEGLVIQGMISCHKNLRKIVYTFKPLLLEGCNLKKVITEYKIFSFGHLCLKMYSRTMLNEHKIRLDTNINIHEDTIFTFECLLKSEFINFVEAANYFYIEDNENSLTKKTYDLKTELYLFEKLILMIDKVKTKLQLTDKELEETAYIMANRLVYRLIRSIYKNKKNLLRRKRLFYLKEIANLKNNMQRLEILSHTSMKYRIIRYLFISNKMRLLDNYLIFMQLISPIRNLLRRLKVTKKKLQYRFSSDTNPEVCMIG